MCYCHDVKKVLATIGFGGVLDLRRTQYHNSSHPIDKVNTDFRKGIMVMRDLLKKITVSKSCGKIFQEIEMLFSLVTK